MQTLTTLFNQQIENLIEKDYPTLAGMSNEDFRKMLKPLQKLLTKELPEIDYECGKLPFAIVINETLVPLKKQMEHIVWRDANGIEKLFPKTPEDFSAIDSVAIPESESYLILNIDRGKDSLNITPENALKAIQDNKRSPLTIAEGIAVVTQYPDFLIKNNCFSLAGSRCGDQRVPAIWISEKRPKLGWCWDRNPHTWLGTASCEKRDIVEA